MHPQGFLPISTLQKSSWHLPASTAPALSLEPGRLELLANEHRHALSNSVPWPRENHRTLICRYDMPVSLGGGQVQRPALRWTTPAAIVPSSSFFFEVFQASRSVRLEPLSVGMQNIKSHSEETAGHDCRFVQQQGCRRKAHCMNEVK